MKPIKKAILLWAGMATVLAGVMLWLKTKKKKVSNMVEEKKDIDKEKTRVENPKIRMVRLSKQTLQRNKRFQDFEIFYNRAKEIFEPYKNKGEREGYFDDLYNLSVCPGSRQGRRESRVVEFFWGNRIFDKNEGLNRQGGISMRFETETGATMFFFKNDDGYVSIQLSPAKTDHRRPDEDFIFWRMRVDPSRLLEKKWQDCCWRAFMAYMEVTSLDGHPTMAQRLYVWYLRNFKYYVEDKRGKSPRYQKRLKDIVSWVVTVGFSGLVIFLLQLLLTPSPAEHDNVKSIQKAVQQTLWTIDNIKTEVDLIRSNQDSLINSQKNLHLSSPNVKSAE